MKLNINIFKGKRKPEGYVEKYLRPQKPEGCERKAVYISRENHEAVRRIIGMLGSRKTTISGYIDRILAEHLDTDNPDDGVQPVGAFLPDMGTQGNAEG